MEGVRFACCQFKLLMENYTLNNEYSLIECYKPLMEKVIVHLNYSNDKIIDVKTEREKFEDIVKHSSLKEFGWYLFLKYTKYKANPKRLKYEDVFVFLNLF